MANPQHIEWLLEGVQAWNARRARGDFVPDFSGVNLRDEIQRVRRRKFEPNMLRPIKLGGVNLSEANLSNAVLGDAELNGANLREANLSGAYLYGANLSEANLSGANFSGADLAYANLAGAGLLHADFGDADLSGIDFNGLDLAKVNFQGANLAGAQPLSMLLYPLHSPPEQLLGAVDYTKIITIEPDKRFGKPCIRGMRITVGDVLQYFASGMSEEAILHDFPYLTHEDILACFAFAAAQERRMLPIRTPL